MLSLSTTIGRLEGLRGREAGEATAIGQGGATLRVCLKVGVVAPRALAALSNIAPMMVGLEAWIGRLAGDFFSCLPEACLTSNSAKAGRVVEGSLDPGGISAPAPEVGEGTREEEEGTPPNPGPDKDGEVGSKGTAAEIAKEEERGQQSVDQQKIVQRKIESFTR